MCRFIDYILYSNWHIHQTEDRTKKIKESLKHLQSLIHLTRTNLNFNLANWAAEVTDTKTQLADQIIENKLNLFFQYFLTERARQLIHFWLPSFRGFVTETKNKFNCCSYCLKMKKEINLFIWILTKGAR